MLRVVDLFDAKVLWRVAHPGEDIPGAGQIITPDHEVEVAHGPQGEALVDELRQVPALEHDDRDAVTTKGLESLGQVEADPQALRGTANGGLLEVVECRRRHRLGRKGSP